MKQFLRLGRFEIGIDDIEFSLKTLLVFSLIGYGCAILSFIKTYQGFTSNNWQLFLLLTAFIKLHWFWLIPLVVMTLLMIGFRYYSKIKSFDSTSRINQSSGYFGSASWASLRDLKQINAFNSATGLPIGKFDNKTLYLPLCNKLTLSPPGTGKTSASSMTALLSYDGPMFVFDVKGELWAVTARFRAHTLKRKVVVIDPFKVREGADFKKGKSQDLLQPDYFNPFDWIPENKQERDRMINAFAASFVVSEGSYAKHFDENAKILIRGMIDYILSLPKEMRTLKTLYGFLSQNSNDAELLFSQMAESSGRAAASAHQIQRVGHDERGSILSTSFRQLDWLGDSNVQETLSKSNFNLADFLKGNMDIYVILPPDQIKEYGRLCRMLLSLLMGMLLKTNPSQLPKKKMLFLFEELAQMGHCPDVEQAIEVFRACGVVVWSVFQTLSQVELFDKPDLFKGAPLKQIFTNDDPKTMEWIQTLGGKKTVLTKTLSNNSGESRQAMQVFGGNRSTGTGESIQETGVDLIPANEIRELAFNEQFIFLQGVKPIRCQKVPYFLYPELAGRFDPNPVESNKAVN
jgi:type IV secretion system protein VirD4